MGLFDSLPQLVDFALPSLPRMDMCTFAAHLPHLCKLTIYDVNKVPMDVIGNLLKAFPTLLLLDLQSLVRCENVSNMSRTGCSVAILKWFHKADELIELLSACPVPVLELTLPPNSSLSALSFSVKAHLLQTPLQISLIWKTISDLIGPTLQTVHSVIEMDQTWSHEDIAHVFSRLTALKSIKLSKGLNTKVCCITDENLQLMAKHCSPFHDVSIDGADSMTNDGVQAILAACGPNLIRLSLTRCKMITVEVLDAMAELSPRLVEVIITGANIKTNDVQTSLAVTMGKLNHMHKLSVNQDFLPLTA